MTEISSGSEQLAQKDVRSLSRRSIDRLPVLMDLHHEEIKTTAKQLEKPRPLTISSEGGLVDNLGNESKLITDNLAKSLVESGYSHLSKMKKLSRGRVSVVRDAGEIVLKEGQYSDNDKERYRLVIAFRHTGQAKDISFFGENLGSRHIPQTEALVIPGPEGPINVIAQEKVDGKPLNEIEALSTLTDTQQTELLHLLGTIQELYEETGRFPDIHGRPVKGVRGMRKFDIRHTDNIIVGKQGVYLIDTDDIARGHSEETFKGWIACKLCARKLHDLRSKLQDSS